jgi:hypothetical protein
MTSRTEVPIYVLPFGSGGPGRRWTQKKVKSEIAIHRPPASAQQILNAYLR